ncbi:TRAP transporter small permease subunit [Halomonas ventosae]|uniref:TRAP transporter small permease protein n=1 Tax=Halomonas ventosae TaxID=229007 RepID=A0A2T0VQ98_9GAMM|nr:TRAP transporter small permease [Halomonas ventosae]PRY72659.1 TRAP-type mannitol/chloroaromatic compound transport system permease small subunit [Halomonas ventosae]
MTQPSPDNRDPAELVGQAEELGPERTALDRLVARGARGAAWLVLIAMGISVVEVFLRYGFNDPTSWVHESVVFLVAVTFALGGPAALARNSHIRVKVLYDSAGPRLRCWMDRFNDLVTLGFCLAMSYAAFHMFWRASHNPLGEWQLERSGTSWNPPFPALVKGMILFALALMTLQAALHLVQSIRARPADHEPANKETR